MNYITVAIIWLNYFSRCCNSNQDGNSGLLSSSTNSVWNNWSTLKSLYTLQLSKTETLHKIKRMVQNDGTTCILLRLTLGLP